jgi:hypothetical protein
MKLRLLILCDLALKPWLFERLLKKCFFLTHRCLVQRCEKLLKKIFQYFFSECKRLNRIHIFYGIYFFADSWI